MTLSQRLEDNAAEMYVLLRMIANGTYVMEEQFSIELSSRIRRVLRAIEGRPDASQ